MKLVNLALVLPVLVYAHAQLVMNTAYGYHAKYGIPLAKKIKESEDARAKAGVIPGNSTQFPWEAGIIIDIITKEDVAVCSGAIVTINRVISAAHCWVDGLDQAWRFTVVLGSTRLFSGGLRIQTHVVVIHPSWAPSQVLNDIAIVQFPPLKSFSLTIAPIALPYGPQMQGYFLGDEVTACGFGIGGQEIGVNNNVLLNHVTLKMADSSICTAIYPDTMRPENMCTSGSRVKGPCGGDAGGPLTRVWNNRTFLIGVVSYGSILGCDAELPSVYTKVTAHNKFLDEYLYVDYLKKLEREDNKRRARAKAEAEAKKANMTTRESFNTLQSKATTTEASDQLLPSATTKETLGSFKVSTAERARYQDVKGTTTEDLKNVVFNTTTDTNHDLKSNVSKKENIQNLRMNATASEIVRYLRSIAIVLQSYFEGNTTVNEVLQTLQSNITTTETIQYLQQHSTATETVKQLRINETEEH